MLPSIFGRNLFDDFGDFPFGGLNHHTTDIMKTDVKEKGDNYELTIDMPGVEKENIKAELNDGYLTVNATFGYSDDDTNDDGRYIRRERHYGSCSRSFYVGDAVTRDDIKASFKNGTLKLTIPKKDDKKLPGGGDFIQID